MDISEAVDPFISYCQSERLVASSTTAKYRDCFRIWILPWLRQVELSALNRMQVLELRKAMVEKKLSVARQYSVITCLKSFLKFCRTVLSQSCLDPAEIKLPNRGTPKVEYLDNEEVQRVLGSINIGTFTGIRLRALIELLLSTGLRISEALSLTRDSFDQRQNSIQVIGKGKHVRQVFLSSRCHFWIGEYLKRRVDDNPALFVTTGYPVRLLKRDDISRFFIQLKAKARITKKFTPHILRHTFCTNLLFHGADITHIRDLAGHHDIQTTARYYLGKDAKVLQEVVEKCLDYGLPTDRSQATAA